MKHYSALKFLDWKQVYKNLDIKVHGTHKINTLKFGILRKGECFNRTFQNLSCEGKGHDLLKDLVDIIDHLALE